MTKREILLTGGLLAMGILDAQVQAQTIPVRISVVPGLSTAGKTDEQITSRFSLNIFGGSTGSVDGVEIGSLFNIDKKNTQYVQVAGLFNMTGGYARGVQAAGLYNTVKGSFKGAQAAGIVNFSGGNVSGLQVAGIHNQASGSFKGIQVAGISNVSNKGIAGIQVAGIFNYARHLKGLQVGLINICDTSAGYGIGLINIVRKGYHKISLSADEVLNANLSIRTGNAKLYNILLVGVNAGTDHKVFSYGYGIGHEFAIGKMFSINPEITAQYMYLGSWHYVNLLSKVHLQLNFRINKYVSIFGGPSFASYYSDQPMQVHAYKFDLPSSNYRVFDLLGRNTIGWFGWNAGVTFF